MDAFAESGNNNLVITVDSLLRLVEYEETNQINLNEYTIFLDEFNSIIEHLLNSDTLKKKRLFIFDYLIKNMI